MKKLHPAWFAAGVVFLTLFATAGFRATPSVLIVPLEDEFGWSRATISAAVSINVLLYGLMAPFAAALMERFGIRRVVMCALTALGTGALCTILDEPTMAIDAAVGSSSRTWFRFDGVGICSVSGGPLVY